MIVDMRGMGRGSVIMLVRFVLAGLNSLSDCMLMVRSTTIVFLLNVKMEDCLSLAFLTHDASTGKNIGAIQQPVPTTGSSDDYSHYR